eukprot:gene6038-12173_t
MLYILEKNCKKSRSRFLFSWRLLQSFFVYISTFSANSPPECLDNNIHSQLQHITLQNYGNKVLVLREIISKVEDIRVDVPFFDFFTPSTVVIIAADVEGILCSFRILNGSKANRKNKEKSLIMLSVPPKRSDPLNLIPSLSKFIQTTFPDDFDKLNTDVTTFQQIRQAAAGVVESSDVNNQYLLRYNHQLSSISSRLLCYEQEIKFSFVWYDAYRANRKFISPSLFFDWACILFNMAAFESQKGTRIDRSTEEGIRTACLHFQQAGGIYKLIKEKILPSIRGGVSPDLSDDGLDMVKQLMLAQAQVCYYEKAILQRKTGGSMKPQILSKLANQAALYYKTAFAFAKGGTMSPHVDAFWPAHIDMQAKTYAGAAEYWAAVGAKEIAKQRGSGYGEEIARLLRAESFLKSALAIAQQGGLSPVLKAAPEQLLQHVTTLRHAAEKDNKTIYLETVPVDATLSDVGVVSLAQVAPPVEYYAGEPLLFKDLLPRHSRTLLLRYQEQLEATVTRTAEEAVTASSNARTQLSAMGLPGSLESFKSGGGLPENLWSKVAHTQSKGGLQELHRQYNALEDAAQRASVTASSIEDSLQREEMSDEIFRRHNSQWTGTASSVLNQDIRKNKTRLLDAFHLARSGDAKILMDLQDGSFTESASCLSRSRVELANQLTAIGSSDLLDVGVHIDTAPLESLLMQLAAVLGERDKDVEAMRQLLSKDVSDQFLGDLTSAEQRDQLLSQCMSICDPFTTNLASSIERQNSLMASITEANRSFQTSRVSDPMTVERERFLRTLEQSVTKYFTLSAQLTAGFTFYAELQSADDLGYTQHLLRQEFDMRLANAFETHNQMDRAFAEKLQNDSNYQQQPGQSQSQSQSHITTGIPCSAPPAGSTLYSTGSAAGRASAPIMYQPAAQNTSSNLPSQPAPATYSYPKIDQSQSQSQSYRQQGQGYGDSQHYNPPTYSSLSQNQNPPAIVYPVPPTSHPYATQGQGQVYTPVPLIHNSAPRPSTSNHGVAQEKIARLIEMGFSHDSAVAALVASNGNEEQAINALLSS